MAEEDDKEKEDSRGDVTERVETAELVSEPADNTPKTDDTKGGDSEPADKADKTDSIKEKGEDFVFSFENLTVHVPGARRNCCSSIHNPIENYAVEYLGVQMSEKDPFYALDDVSGYLRGGEMCLVLGSNDMTKSTLLRALSGRLNEKDELYGTILLNGMPMGMSNQGWRRLSPYVAATDASHSPVLTVKETFTFAAQCTSDGKQDPADLEERVQYVMEALGLDHVADTVVGDENLRGISGGQKRRVTVGEMLFDPNATFFCLENITDGLASTDSLSLIQRLSLYSHQGNRAGFISLLQPSDEMVKCFDKLLVLTSHGELAYFGPVDRSLLRDVFLGPNVDPAEDAGSICDLVLKHSLTTSFYKEDAVVKRFATSAMHDDLVKSLSNIRSSAPPARERDVDALLPDKKYSTSRWYQFYIISARRLKLIARNAVTWTRVIIAIVFGVIIGSLFSALNNDLLGALGRTGYMFLNSFLVLMLSAAVTIPASFRERVTLFKHRSAEFFSGRVAYLSQVLLDAPLSILEGVLLSSITYYWVDMNSGANHFFFFMACLIGLECVGQALGRLLCALIRKQVSANAYSSVFILLFGTVAGFMPSYTDIPTIFRWLNWLTPVSYAFEAMMINEFHGRDVYGVTVTNENGERQLGESAGDQWIKNFGLPRAAFASPNGLKIFDLFMLFFFAFIYDLIGAYYIEQSRAWYHSQIRRPQSKVISKAMAGPSNHKARSTTSSKMEEGSAAMGEGSGAPDEAWPQTLSVKKLFYSVVLKSDRRFNVHSLLGPCLVKLSGSKVQKKEASPATTLTLLQGVDAHFQRGRMTALMGTSGAGKTTLMDVIAGYKTGGIIEGDILLDGKAKVEATWKKISGYAEQNDILNPYLSVLETLRFTAECRLPRGDDKQAAIDRVVRLMELEEWTDVVVGRELEGEGLPKHARKRLTIAIQLVISPRVLFLDEPTSNLGNNASSLVIQAIRRSTDELGLITLATIHQPSKVIWDSFDDLLLLAKGGRVTYMGERGPNSKNVLDHFSSLSGTAPPPQCNPADFVLSALNSVSPEDAVAAFANSPHRDTLSAQLESDEKSTGVSVDTAVDLSRPNGRLREFSLLTNRHILTQWRNPGYSFMRITCSIGVSLYMGILFYGDKSVVSGAVASIGAIFFLVFVLVIPMQAAVIPLVEDRAVLYRETVSGTYSRLSYGLGQMAADIPFHLLNALLMFVCFYFIAEFRDGWEYVGYFVLMLFMANWSVMAMGQLYALVTPNEESANGLAGLSVMLSVILMGFLITVDAMPDGWVWAYWTNLFRYILQGLVTNELAGQTYHLDLGIQLPNITTPENNVTNAVVFGHGVDPASSSASQVASLLGLVALAGAGINPEATTSVLSDWISCNLENDCFEDPVASNFVSCNIFKVIGSPPCKDTFDALTASIDPEEVTQCFLPANFTGEPLDSGEAAKGVPSDFTTDAFEDLPERDRMELVLCLLRALLPDSALEAIQRIMDIIKTLLGFVAIVLDIVENGIDLPGSLILFFFGWAEFELGEGVVAPWKWHYCMTAVAAFLVGLEVLKLGAIRFIVWTKR